MWTHPRGKFSSEVNHKHNNRHSNTKILLNINNNIFSSSSSNLLLHLRINLNSLHLRTNSIIIGMLSKRGFSSIFSALISIYIFGTFNHYNYRCIFHLSRQSLIHVFLNQVNFIFFGLVFRLIILVMKLWCQGKLKKDLLIWCYANIYWIFYVWCQV